MGHVVGVLIIGVHDEQHVIGIDVDYRLTGHGGRDGSRTGWSRSWRTTSARHRPHRWCPSRSNDSTRETSVGNERRRLRVECIWADSEGFPGTILPTGEESRAREADASVPDVGDRCETEGMVDAATEVRELIRIVRTDTDLPA